VVLGTFKPKLVVVGPVPNQDVEGTVTGYVETGTESVEKVVVSKQPFKQVLYDTAIVVRL